MKFGRRLTSLWQSVCRGRGVVFAVGALLLAAMTLVFPANRSGLSSTRFFEAVAAVSGIIFAAYSVAIAIVTKIEPLTNSEGTKRELMMKVFTLFAFSVVIQSVTLGILFSLLAYSYMISLMRIPPQSKKTKVSYLSRAHEFTSLQHLCHVW